MQSCETEPTAALQTSRQADHWVISSLMSDKKNGRMKIGPTSNSQRFPSQWARALSSSPFIIPYIQVNAKHVRPGSCNDKNGGGVIK